MGGGEQGFVGSGGSGMPLHSITHAVGVKRGSCLGDGGGWRERDSDMPLYSIIASSRGGEGMYAWA